LDAQSGRRVDRRRHAAQQKRAAQADSFERLSQDAGAQRLDVDDDVGQLGQALILRGECYL
jgi:hypothetical protein